MSWSLSFAHQRSGGTLTGRSIFAWYAMGPELDVLKHALMANGLSLARQVLAAQPFSALLGAEITQFGDGEAELRIAVSDKLRQQHGFVHGGVLSYAADNALTFAGGSALGP